MLLVGEVLKSEDPEAEVQDTRLHVVGFSLLLRLSRIVGLAMISNGLY